MKESTNSSFGGTFCLNCCWAWSSVWFLKTSCRRSEKPVSLQDNFKRVNIVPNAESVCTASSQRMCLSHNLSFNTKGVIFFKEELNFNYWSVQMSNLNK